MDKKKVLIVGGILATLLLFLAFKAKARDEDDELPEEPPPSPPPNKQQQIQNITTKEEMLDFIYDEVMNIPRIDRNTGEELPPNFDMNYQKWKEVEPKISSLPLEDLKQLWQCEMAKKAGMTSELYKICMNFGKKYPDLLS